MKIFVCTFPSLSAMGLLVFLCAMACSAAEPARFSLWIDAYEGEPTEYEDVIDDLAGAKVIYLGERHTLVRHHDLQRQIVADLAARKIPLVLGLEQLDVSQQPTVDQYNDGKIDFEQLAKAVDWAHRWHNYAQYRDVLETARKAGAPVLGLNARSETIRRVARGGGVEKLDAETRKELPAEMQLKDPTYEKLLSLQLMVHMAASPEKLRPMIEAQIARDEMMSATLAGFLTSDRGRGRTAIVLCGAGHVSYGLGTADRVRRRLGDVKDRIVLFSESGDVELSAEEKAMARSIHITHDQLRSLNRPLADYLHVISRKNGGEK